MIKSHVLYQLSYGLAHINGLRKLHLCPVDIGPFKNSCEPATGMGSNSMMGDDGKRGLRRACAL